MKFLIFLAVFIAFVASSWALKNEICGQTHSLNGNGIIACEALFPSWTYNSENKECLKFIYGGCGGNDNRFGSKEDCEEKCLE
ncbi:male accessory gland serine protease inhibitor-like [Drosophila kikkawai]|uniref:Male accessory gland serine protease inhibitor-like n=1 Tax=Drosophila kikkawai TaxID=30033 RepID=A0A6P4JAH1_DROKI|nr:male accessory gland serine protease inhibitor-like [Drosophila kikkawai]